MIIEYDKNGYATKETWKALSKSMLDPDHMPFSWWGNFILDLVSSAQMKIISKEDALLNLKKVPLSEFKRFNRMNDKWKKIFIELFPELKENLKEKY